MLTIASVVIILWIGSQWEASSLASYTAFKGGYTQSFWLRAHAVQPRIWEYIKLMIGDWMFPWYMQEDRNCCTGSNKWLVKSIALLPAMPNNRGFYFFFVVLFFVLLFCFVFKIKEHQYCFSTTPKHSTQLCYVSFIFFLVIFIKMLKISDCFDCFPSM